MVKECIHHSPASGGPWRCPTDAGAVAGDEAGRARCPEWDSMDGAASDLDALAPSFPLEECSRKSSTCEGGEGRGGPKSELTFSVTGSSGVDGTIQRCDPVNGHAATATHSKRR